MITKLKTRMTIANMCHAFAPKFWDIKTQSWMDNPNGTQNSCLYIGTEMELIEEIEPIILAYMANVPQHHITMGMYDDGEEERVDEAIKYLDQGHIYLAYVPEYDIATLDSIIKYHKQKYKISAVFFDYIHTTTELISEFTMTSNTNKMSIREDQVLANLSTKLKDLSREHNISIDSWTQVSGSLQDDRVKDGQLIRGSKAIQDKCDIGAIMSRPTTKELDKIQKILREAQNIGKPQPNICISLYKNRGGKDNNVKIWLYVEYSTMRVSDLFITDNDYNPLPHIPQTFVYVTEDEKIHVTNDKSSIRSGIHAAQQYHSISVNTCNVTGDVDVNQEKVSLESEYDDINDPYYNDY